MDAFHATVDDGENRTCLYDLVRLDVESALHEDALTAASAAIDCHENGVDNQLYTVELRTAGTDVLTRYTVAISVERHS